MSTFYVERLPEVDQQCLKRGLCPWCLEKLTPGGLIEPDSPDSCPECDDVFVGKLTIAD